MGIIDCEGLRDKATEAGLSDILLYAGGILTTDDRPWEETRKRFEEIGFTRAYPPGTLPNTFLADFAKDLAGLTR
jgi:methylaspartate mutase sigma subunit